MSETDRPPRKHIDSISDIDLVERLTRLEITVKDMKKNVDKMAEKSENLFHRYGWPLVQVLIWISLFAVLGIKNGALP